MIRGSRYKLPIEVRVLKYCRLRFGFTQKRMAVILDINQSQISRMERGLRVLTSRMRQKIEALISMTIEDLILEFENNIKKIKDERRNRRPSTLPIILRARNRKNKRLTSVPVSQDSQTSSTTLVVSEKSCNLVNASSSAQATGKPLLLNESSTVLMNRVSIIERMSSAIPFSFSRTTFMAKINSAIRNFLYT